MGGHMAAITAAVSPFPVACAALAAGASAGNVYTRGLMAWGVDFEGLGGGLAQREAAQERLQRFYDAADITRYRCPCGAMPQSSALHPRWLCPTL